MSAPKLAVVTALYETNARQIPEMMRKLASEVEDPPIAGANPDQCVCIIRDSQTGQINVYGWGNIDIEDSLAMLAVSTRKLSALADGGDLWTLPVGGSAPKEPA